MSALIRRVLRPEPLAETIVSLYELPMAYPSVRWRQVWPAPPTGQAPDAARRERDEWLARTAILLIEDQLPLLPAELRARTIGRIDEFVDYRMTWDNFRQQVAPREEGGRLLAELIVTIVDDRPPRIEARLKEHARRRSPFTVLATILDNFTSDSIRLMTPGAQSWACLWLTYLIRWYEAGGAGSLRGRASAHPRFFVTGGVPEVSEFPGGTEGVAGD